MNATIRVKDEQGQLPQLFAAEERRLVNDRADYKVLSEGEEAVFHITAKDPVALRAVLNSICKILIVHNKVKEVITDGNE